MAERTVNPLPARRKRLALALLLPGLMCFAVGSYLIWFDIGLLAIVVSLLGVALLLAGLMAGTVYVLLPLAEPGYYTLEEKGILVESGPSTPLTRAMTWNPNGNTSGWGSAKRIIPWSGVLKIRRRGGGERARFWLLLVDWDRPPRPGSPTTLITRSHKPWPWQLSRIELSAADWDSVRSKVPPSVLRP